MLLLISVSLPYADSSRTSCGGGARPALLFWAQQAAPLLPCFSNPAACADTKRREYHPWVYSFDIQKPGVVGLVDLIVAAVYDRRPLEAAGKGFPAVILSGAKNLALPLRVNCVKNPALRVVARSCF
jgi:hypothetical protein